MFTRATASLSFGAAALLTALLLTGCAGGVAATRSPLPHPQTRTTSPAPTPTPPAAPASIGTSATAIPAQVAVYGSPDGAVTETLANPQPSGAPLTFLVASTQGAWLQVDLAQRPNGSTGWVKADGVTLHSLVYSLHASTEQNTLTLLKNGTPVKTYTAATGTGGTPTPHGSFYITELLQPTNDGYGPYAFGLSAFSDVLSSFGGGPGQIGLHGTNDAGSIGHSASHGCIRLANPDITELATLLPLGTPITIN
ncbi:L,D-transpeptidase family protein [Leifsonia sp. L25]|uniref:L,D-transpeptidase family protein n=1 Tax=Actinomycetes TaxID=1760 RepID=UPI003D69846A